MVVGTDCTDSGKFNYHTIMAVPELDKERPYAIVLVRSLQILHLHDLRKMEVCLVNFNKGDDDGCLKFRNILKWSATV